MESREARARRLAHRAAGQPESTAWPAWVVVVLLTVCLASLWFARVLHIITLSPDRSDRISGVWIGRTVFQEGSPDQWAMPREGEGTWVIEVNSSMRLLTSEDATSGSVRVCTDDGTTGSAQFDSGRLVNGVASLDTYQSGPSTIRLDNASLSPRGDKLFFSGSANHGEIRGVLHRGTAGEFKRTCK